MLESEMERLLSLAKSKSSMAFTCVPAGMPSSSLSVSSAVLLRLSSFFDSSISAEDSQLEVGELLRPILNQITWKGGIWLDAFHSK